MGHLKNRRREIDRYHAKHGLPRALSAHLELFDRLYTEGDLAESRGALTDLNLALLDEAIACSYSEVWCDGVKDLLVGWSSFAPRVLEQWVRDRTKDRNAMVRWHVVQITEAIQPDSLRDEVLRGALKDRSAKVREFATDRILFGGHEHLLPALREAFALETIESLRAWMARTTALLADGYVMGKGTEDGRVDLEVLLPYGIHLTSLSTTEASGKGAAQAAQRIRREYVRVHGKDRDASLSRDSAGRDQHASG